MKPNWGNWRRRFLQAGTALVLLAPVFFDTFLCILELHGPAGFPGVVLVFSSFGAVGLGVLLLLLGAACTVATRRSLQMPASNRAVSREETVLRRTLTVTVVVILTGFSSLAVVLLAPVGGALRVVFDALFIAGQFILLIIVPILYLMLIFAWLRLLKRRRAIARAAPPEEPGPSEDGEK